MFALVLYCLRLAIGFKKRAPLLGQSEVKPKPIATRLLTFPRPLYRLRVFASSFDWITGMSWFCFYDTQLKTALICVICSLCYLLSIVVSAFKNRSQFLVSLTPNLLRLFRMADQRVMTSHCTTLQSLGWPRTVVTKYIRLPSCLSRRLSLVFTSNASTSAITQKGQILTLVLLLESKPFSRKIKSCYPCACACACACVASENQDLVCHIRNLLTL